MINRIQVDTGFSLIEVLVSLVIISLALVAWAFSFTAAVHGPERAEYKSTGVNLAQGFLEEIRRVSFSDPNQTPSFGLESGETTVPATRVNFDDVDDYNLWSESPPMAKDGTVISGFNEYGRKVTVVNVYQDNFNQDVTQGSSDFKKVTVSVTEGSITVAELSTVFIKGY